MMSISTSHLNSSVGFNDQVKCIFNPTENQKKQVIAIIYIVTSLLSILGSGSVLFYAALKRIIRSPEVHPLFHLALADLLLASLWLTGACSWFHEKYRNCFYLDVIGETANLASFFLTVNYALTAFIRLREKSHNISNLQLLREPSSRKFYVWLSRICYALCWLAPVVIMLPLLIHGEKHMPKQRTCTLCLLLFDRPKLTKSPKNMTSFWWWYGSVVLTASLTFSIVAMVVLYFLMLRVYRKAVFYSGVLTDLQRASIDAIRNKIFLYILVFLVCWIPALVVASCDIDPSIDLASLDLENWFILFVFQALTAPMQGFFNCIVYGWARKSFREASDRRPLLLESDEYVVRRFYGSSSLRKL